MAKARYLAMRQASEAVRAGLLEVEARRRAGLPDPPWPRIPYGILSDDETDLWNYDPPLNVRHL